MTKTMLNDIFCQFDVNAEVVGVRQGPSVTRYEVKLARGTKINSVLSLHKDIVHIFGNENIQLVSPLEGGLIGVEIPRKDREIVEFGAIYESGVLSAPLDTILGNDMDGNAVTIDMSKMPHLLVAGATGSGKSVFINTMICSVISRMSPAEVRLVLIDPKQVELSVYANLPHLAYPLVTDAREAGAALSHVVNEMTHRYDLLSKNNVRNISEYNTRIASGEIAGEALPLWLVVIDELADLMMVARKDVEKSIVRITQLARAAGIHLVVATQRPSVDVITGLIKANMPSRLAFAVASKTDSRVILDQMGAEVLTGMGDSLFVPQGTFKAQRIQGAYISTEEVEEVVSLWKNFSQHKEEVPVSSFWVIKARALKTATSYMSEGMLQRSLRVTQREAIEIINIIDRGENVGTGKKFTEEEIFQLELDGHGATDDYRLLLNQKKETAHLLTPDELAMLDNELKSLDDERRLRWNKFDLAMEEYLDNND